MATNIRRQAAMPKNQSADEPPGAEESPKSTGSEMKMPGTIANCCSDPRSPRIFAGVISAMYAGAIMGAIPTAMPPTWGVSSARVQM
jgi:hypothetical protein